MSDWTDTALGEVLQFQRGFDITKKEQENGIFPVVSSSGIASYHNKAKGKAPGVVIGRKGTLGTVHYVNRDYWAHDTTLWVKDFKDNLPKFIYYFLKVMHLENYDTGASNPTLNRNHIHKIKLKFPPLPVQKKIAAVLSAYDDLTENNDRRIALLEKMAEEIYREWFVRLRFPRHEQVTFHKGIPEGWEYLELGHLLDIKHGYAFKGEFFSQEPTPNILLTPGNFAIGGGYKDDKLKYYNGSIPEDYILEASDMIVTMTDLSKAGDTLGYPAFVPPSEEYRFLHNQRLGKVLIRDKRIVGKHFIYNVFCSELYRYHVVGSATGATVKHTAPERIKSFQILLPHRALMQDFEKQIDVIRNQIILLSGKNNILKQTRDRLLTRLISSKLSVEDLDIQLPPSMTADS